jgi:hypothetical protein
MKKSGWTSADGYDDVKMLNALGLKADIIGYYPWIEYIFTAPGS